MYTVRRNLGYTLSFALITLFIFQGCDVTSSDQVKRSNFDVEFAVASSQNFTNNTTTLSSTMPDSLKIEGDNGTLTIHDIHFIVGEFKVEREDDVCESDTTDNDDSEGEDGVENDTDEECEEEFETSGIFVDLPLDGSSIDAVSGTIPEGTFSELKFEVEDIDFDEEAENEEEEGDDNQSLIDSVKAKFPNWPEDASMVVSGSFRESGSDTTRFFQTFVEAEIKVEKEFDPPLTVTGDEVPRAMKITLHPDIWFMQSDGTVWDLSQYDYEKEGELLKMEVKMENGFGKLEIEDDHDDDEDDGDEDDDNDEED